MSGELHPNFSAHDLKARSSRADDLPFELLSVIFKLVHQDLSTRKGALFKGINAFSMTSKRWHEVASSIPELWSTLEIIIDDQEETSHSKLLTTTTTFLERSGNLPLSVMLSFEHPRCDFVRKRTMRFIMTTFGLLLNNFQRWRSVSFDFGNITFELPPLPRQVVAPFLEHIDIKFHSPWIPNPSYYAALVAAAPGLRSYVAHASNCNVPPNLPWGQLHKFHPASPIRQSDAYGILNRAKSLQEFHFVIHRDPGRVIAPPPVRITSPIRSMSVTGHGTCLLDFLIFSRLDTPHLKALGIFFLMHVVPRNIGLAQLPQQHDILSSFLSNGSFRLSSLTIGDLLMTESQLMDCLRLLSPSLTTLKILTNTSLKASDIHIFESFTNIVLISLTSHDISTRSGLLCPALESLTLGRCVGADDGVLSDMIQSRHGPSPTAVDRPSTANVAILRHLEVVFDANTAKTHPTDLMRLSEFYQEGLCGRIWQLPPEVETASQSASLMASTTT